MAVDPDAPQVERFISIGGERGCCATTVAVPLVVYVPRRRRSPPPTSGAPNLPGTSCRSLFSPPGKRR
jgi:hypothetical protein